MKPTDGIRRKKSFPAQKTLRPADLPQKIEEVREKKGKSFIEKFKEKNKLREYANQPEEFQTSEIESSKEEEAGIIITPEEASTEISTGDIIVGIPGVWSYSKKKFRSYWAVGSLLVLILFFVTFSTVFARMTIRIKPRVEGINIQDTFIVFDAAASKTSNQSRIIPAQKFDLAKNIVEEFSSTGKKRIEEKAQGTIKLYNKYSTSPQTLVQGTRLVSDSGIIFRLAQTVKIPGVQVEEGRIIPTSVQTQVSADKVGEESNLGRGVSFRIPGFQGTPKYDGFYAVSETALQGGYKGDASVVTASDIKSAEESLTKKIFAELEQEITRKVPPHLVILPQFREIEITKVEAPKADSRLDRFPVKVEAVARTLVFRNEDVENFVKNLLTEENDKNKTFVPGSVKLNYSIRAIDLGKGRADVTLKGEAKTMVAPPPQDIKALAAGKKEGTVADLLKDRQDLSSFRLSFFPPWIFQAPGSTEKIKVIIEEPNR